MSEIETDEKINNPEQHEKVTQDVQSQQDTEAQKDIQSQGDENEDPKEHDDGGISWDDAFKEEADADKVPEKDSSTAVETKKQNEDNLTSKVEESTEIPKDKSAKKPVTKVEFSQFDESDKTTEAPKNLDFILDIPLTISVELGRTKMVINDMLQLGQGSVIELEKLAGEPLDVYVNGKLMARGEVVLVNDKFGVRLTDIISPAERIKRL